MRWRARAVATALLALGWSGPAASQDAHWLPAWIASAAPPRFDVIDGAPLIYRDQTIRQDLRVGVSARALRVRLSNELGTAPVRLRSLRLSSQAGEVHILSFSSEAEVTLEPGVALISDPVEMAVDRGEVVTVSLHVPEAAPGVVRRTPVRLGLGGAAVADDAPLERRQGFVSAIYALTDDRPAVVVALGDSITEGATATLGAEADWPAVLNRRLEQQCPGDYLVLNAGISGNQVVRDGRSPNVRSRLDRDVMSLPGVTHVILIEGINDIRHDGNPANPGRDPDEVLAGYRQVVARLKLRGVQVLGGTLTPFAGSERHDDRSEASRQTINQAIRDGGIFDRIVDFDAALRDPVRPEAMAEGTHRDDRLHPNDDGYRRMAMTPTFPCLQS
ncbi:GDSL-type esterase/lipase family protein [Brevundimonas bacteroides]|uniref:GDSL-type esterase/lipase family protein n=1 Tax=Brevundimonas bacteroides TaxID=74311 RepID=UPI0004952715|nr:GDSL-type esterase/lipase family protein [Brevundimonas bacteroides]